MNNLHGPPLTKNRSLLTAVCVKGKNHAHTSISIITDAALQGTTIAHKRRIKNDPQSK